MTDYTNYNDTELIRKYRDGDFLVMDYLLDKYKYLVRKKANTLFLLGGDTDDLIQEGMIGLFKAVRDYDENAGGFYPFAELCITRQIYTAIESAARKKHGPLNSYVSLSTEQSMEGGKDLSEGFAANVQNPEQMMIDRENVDDFLSNIYDHLSKMEKMVLEEYLQGLNYRQIAEKSGKSEKSIDNALQRIKTKVNELLARKDDI